MTGRLELIAPAELRDEKDNVIGMSPAGIRVFDEQNRQLGTIYYNPGKDVEGCPTETVLQALGVQFEINLAEPERLISADLNILRRLGQTSELRGLNLPSNIADWSRPEHNPAYLIAVLDQMRALFNTKDPITIDVHCEMGISRTPSFIAALLTRMEFDKKTVMAALPKLEAAAGIVLSSKLVAVAETSPAVTASAPVTPVARAEEAASPDLSAPPLPPTVTQTAVAAAAAATDHRHMLPYGLDDPSPRMTAGQWRKAIASQTVTLKELARYAPAGSPLQTALQAFVASSPSTATVATRRHSFFHRPTGHDTFAAARATLTRSAQVLPENANTTSAGDLAIAQPPAQLPGRQRSAPELAATAPADDRLPRAAALRGPQ